MIKIFDILLELENKSKNLPFTVSQNDLNAIRVNMTILNDGIPLTIAGITSARIAIKKPSGLSVIQDCEIVDSSKGKISVILSTQAYAEIGKHDAEIYLYEGDTVSVTSTFSYTSKKAILDNGTVTSTNDWQSINNALIRIENADVYTKSEADVKLAEKAKQTDVNNALALKSDKTYVDTQLGITNATVGLKADKSYVDAQLADKATQTALNTTNANVTANTNAIALKADKTYVDTSLVDKVSFKNNNTTYGTYDTAGGLGVLANAVPGRKLPILGIPPENQSLLSTYPDRDSVALYVENNSATRPKCTNNVTFTSTTVTTTDDISSCKVGMVIDTLHTPNKYSGIVTSTSGNVITVSAWYLVDGVTLTPQTPPNNAGFIINPITKVWGQNMNVYLRNAEDPKSAAAMEIGLFNDKTGGTMWGVDVVSFGSVTPQYGYQARRVSSSAARIGTGYYSENATTSFESYQDAASMVAFKASVNNSSQNWFVTSDGMQNKLRVQVQSVGNGVTAPTDANQTAFLFTNTTPQSFTVPTSGGVTGKLLFFYNSGTANVTLSGSGGVVFGGSNTDSSTYLLPPRCFAIFMSNGGVVWFPVASNTNNTLIGTAAPTSTPIFIGQEFLDTTNRKMYKAFGTSSSTDWVIMN